MKKSIQMKMVRTQWKWATKHLPDRVVATEIESGRRVVRNRSHAENAFENMERAARMILGNGPLGYQRVSELGTTIWVSL